MTLYLLFAACFLFGCRAVLTHSTCNGERYAEIFPEDGCHTEQTSLDDQQFPKDGSDEQMEGRNRLSVHVLSTNGKKACLPPIMRGDWIEIGCRSKIDLHIRMDRIPRVLPQVTCVSSLPVMDTIRSRRGVMCDEVTYLAPTLYATDDKMSQFRTVWESVSVACVKTVKPSLVLEERPLEIPTKILQ